MRYVVRLLAGAAIAALMLSWFHIWEELTLARSQAARNNDVAEVSYRVVNSCLSSLALCVKRDDARESVFRSYLDVRKRPLGVGLRDRHFIQRIITQGESDEK